MQLTYAWVQALPIWTPSDRLCCRVFEAPMRMWLGTYRPQLSTTLSNPLFMRLSTLVSLLLLQLGWPSWAASRRLLVVWPRSSSTTFTSVSSHTLQPPSAPMPSVQLDIHWPSWASASRADCSSRDSSSFWAHVADDAMPKTRAAAPHHTFITCPRFQDSQRPNARQIPRLVPSRSARRGDAALERCTWG